jgi:hypothetical protein
MRTWPAAEMRAVRLRACARIAAIRGTVSLTPDENTQLMGCSASVENHTKRLAFRDSDPDLAADVMVSSATWLAT